MAHEKVKALYRKWLKDDTVRTSTAGNKVYNKFTEWLDTQPEAPVMSGEEIELIDKLALCLSRASNYLNNLSKENEFLFDKDGIKKCLKSYEDFKSHPPINLLQVPTHKRLTEIIFQELHGAQKIRYNNTNTEIKKYASDCSNEILLSSQPTTEKLKQLLPSDDEIEKKAKLLFPAYDSETTSFTDYKSYIRGQKDMRNLFQSNLAEIDNTYKTNMLFPTPDMVLDSVIDLRERLKKQGKDENFADINSWIMGSNYTIDFVKKRITLLSKEKVLEILFITLGGRSENEKAANQICSLAIPEGENKQGWISVEDRLPICFQSGNWDGKKSSNMLILDKNGNHHEAICYSGALDGSEFYTFYGLNDFEINNITHWQPLPEAPKQ